LVSIVRTLPVRVGEATRTLIAAQGAVGGAVEEAVDRDEPAPAREHVLQHRDVPADVPAAQGAAAEDGRPERTERAPRRGAGASVDREPGTPLECLRRAHRHRPRDRVDRPLVEPVCAQGDLKTRDLRVPGLGGRRQRQTCQHRRADRDDLAGHRMDPVRASARDSYR
jgi:hypothetical protein